MTQEEFLKFIETNIRDVGATETAKLTTIPRTQLYQLYSTQYRYGGNPTLNTLFRLCDALGWELEIRKKSK